jgi:MoxR-like ATPase
MALLTEGRAATEPSDLDILRHSLWEKPDERQAVGAIVRKFCVDTTTQKYERLLKDAKEVYEQAIAQKTTEAGTEANKKLKATIQQLKDLADKSPSKKTQIESGLAQVASYNQEVLSVCLGI